MPASVSSQRKTIRQLSTNRSSYRQCGGYQRLGGWGKWKDGQRVQTSSYKMNNLRGYNEQHGDSS